MHTLNDKISVFVIIIKFRAVFLFVPFSCTNPWTIFQSSLVNVRPSIATSPSRIPRLLCQFQIKRQCIEWTRERLVRHERMKQNNRAVRFEESKRCYGDAILLIHYMFAFSIHLLLLPIRWARCFHSLLFVRFGCRFEPLIEHTAIYYVILGVQQEFELVCVRMFRIYVCQWERDAATLGLYTHTEHSTLLMLYKYGDYLCRHIYMVFTIELLNRQKPKAYTRKKITHRIRNEWLNGIRSVHSHSTYTQFIPLIHDPILEIPCIQQCIYTYQTHIHTHSVRIHFFSVHLAWNSMQSVLFFLTSLSILCFLFRQPVQAYHIYKSILSFWSVCFSACFAFDSSFISLFHHLSLSQPYKRQPLCCVCIFFPVRVTLSLFLCGYYFVVIEAHIFLYRWCTFIFHHVVRLSLTNSPCLKCSLSLLVASSASFVSRALYVSLD